MYIQAKYQKGWIKVEGGNSNWKKIGGRWTDARRMPDGCHMAWHWISSTHYVSSEAKRKEFRFWIHNRHAIIFPDVSCPMGTICYVNKFKRKTALIFNSHQTSYVLPVWVSYEMSIENILEKTDHVRLRLECNNSSFIPIIQQISAQNAAL